MARSCFLSSSHGCSNSRGGSHHPPRFELHRDQALSGAKAGKNFTSRAKLVTESEA